MEQNDKIRLLLDMHEHPENYTDQQLAAMLDDDLQEQFATAKRAMTDTPEPDVDAEWQRFEQQHFAPVKNRRWLKVAAMIAGVLMLSAFTYAAIHAVRARQPEPQQTTTQQVEKTDGIIDNSAPTSTEVIDSISMEQPVTFDNVTLETIISDIAARHQMQADFRNEEARGLRFYFELHPGEDLNSIIERLNMFERVSVSIEGNTIVVE